MDSAPPTGGFMIFIYVALIGLFGLLFVAYSIDSQSRCKHEYLAEFRSRKVKQCIDCGKEFKSHGY
jgi:CHASE1-domain containing sensor protein